MKPNLRNTFRNVLKTAAPEAYAKAAVASLTDPLNEKYRAAKGPALDVPTPKPRQFVALAGLGFPPTDDMVAEMATIVHDKSVMQWRHTGAAWDAPGMDVHLGDHPHLLIGRAVMRMAWSSFPDEDFIELETCFSTGLGQSAFDDGRVLQIYALYTYLAKDARMADAVARILPIGTDLADMRGAIQSAMTLYAAQSVEVAAFDAAMKARTAATTTQPKWQDFLKTRKPAG